MITIEEAHKFQPHHRETDRLRHNRPELQREV
jgi:hypothetical protein